MKKVLLGALVAALVLGFGLPHMLSTSDVAVDTTVLEESKEEDKEGSTGKSSETSKDSSKNTSKGNPAQKIVGSNSSSEVPDIYATSYGRDSEGNATDEVWEDSTGRNWDSVNFGTSFVSDDIDKQSIDGMVSLDPFDAVLPESTGLQQDVIVTDNSAEIKAHEDAKKKNWVDTIKDFIAGKEDVLEPTVTTLEGFVYGSETAGSEQKSSESSVGSEQESNVISATGHASQNLLSEVIDISQKEATRNGKNSVLNEMGLNYCNSILGLAAEGNALAELENAWDVSALNSYIKNTGKVLDKNEEISAKLTLWDFTNGAVKFKSDFVKSVDASQVYLLKVKESDMHAEYNNFLEYTAAEIFPDEVGSENSLGLASIVEFDLKGTQDSEPVRRFTEEFHQLYAESDGLKFSDDDIKKTFVELNVRNGVKYKSGNSEVYGIPTEEGILFCCTGVETSREIQTMVKQACNESLLSDFTVVVPEIEIKDLLDHEESLKLYSQAGVFRSFSGEEYSPKRMLSSWKTEEIKMIRPIVGTKFRFSFDGLPIEEVVASEDLKDSGDSEVHSELDMPSDEETAASIDEGVKAISLDGSDYKIDETFGFGYFTVSYETKGYGRSQIRKCVPDECLISGIVNK